MGLDNLPTIVAWLLTGGCEPHRPVALIQSGTLGSQTCRIGTGKTITDIAEQSNRRAPTLIIIGEVVKLGQDLHNICQGSASFCLIVDRLDRK